MMSQNHQLFMYISELETKISFQERAIEELNQSLIAQQMILDKLQIKLRYLSERLHSGQFSNIAPQSEEIPPPHY